MPKQDMIPFSKDEQNALNMLVGHIIPASDAYNQPSASDPVIFSDILASGAELHGKLAKALASLPTDGDITFEHAMEFKAAFPAEAEMIQVLTAQCYYRDDRVMAALNIDVRAPFPKGYQQEPNDLTLLDPVRARGEIYRKVE